MCPVDLTRTIPTDTNKDATRKLAFSVENILDPNKFCSKKDKFNNARNWIENYERGERDHLDDDQSESQSGEWWVIFMPSASRAQKIFKVNYVL